MPPADRGRYLPLVRGRTGLVLDPYFSATKAAWLLAESGLDLDPDDPDLSFCTVDTWLLWNLTGGTAGGPTPPIPPTLAAPSSSTPGPGLVARALCALRRARPHPGRGPPLGRPLRRRPLGDSAPPPPVPTALPCRACWATSRPPLWAGLFEPGMVKVTYGTGSFALVNAGPERPPAPDGLTVSCAWDLGDAVPAPARIAYALEGSVFVSGAAIQWLRDGLGIISEAAEIGPLAASVPDSGGVVFVPALTGLGSPQWDP